MPIPPPNKKTISKPSPIRLYIFFKIELRKEPEFTAIFNSKDTRA